MHIFLALSFLMLACMGQVSSLQDPLHRAAHELVLVDTVSEPGNNIMAIYQDRQQRYWWGSWETGLYRYDGQTILHYTVDDGLGHFRVDEIKEDKAGSIFITTTSPDAAILRFDGERFEQLEARADNDWRLHSDDTWFKGTFNANHVYRFDGSVLHELTLPENPACDMPYEIYSIYQDTQGDIWFGTNPCGVCRYNGIRFDWISESDVTELHNGPANGVRSIIQDKDGFFWFNSNYRYEVLHQPESGSTKFYERHPGIGNLDGGKDNNLSEWLSITKDLQNRLWIATYRNGVWMYDGKKVTHFRVQADGEDIHLFCIYCDHDGCIWLGSQEDGLWKMEGDGFRRFALK